MIIILDPIVLVPIADQAALVMVVVAEDHLEVVEEVEEDKQPVLTFNFDIKLNQPIKYEKYIFLLALGLSINNARSQDISDAMRYAQDNLTGTARYRAMSGAFGALGGDLSSLNVNPAGSAVFSNNQMGLTLSNYNVKNNANYFGTTTKDASTHLI
jgi:hypothetical protein